MRCIEHAHTTASVKQSVTKKTNNPVGGQPMSVTQHVPPHRMSSTGVNSIQQQQVLNSL